MLLFYKFNVLYVIYVLIFLVFKNKKYFSKTRTIQAVEFHLEPKNYYRNKKILKNNDFPMFDFTIKNIK